MMWVFKKGKADDTLAFSQNNSQNERLTIRTSTPLLVSPSVATTITTCTAMNSASSKNSGYVAPRPDLAQRSTSQTRYIDMLLGLDNIPRMHNIYASFFTWLLLAGYVVFPATFTAVNKSSKITQIAESGNVIEQDIFNGIRNAPLLYIAAGCCTLGASGMVWLWCRWRNNYVWMINRIFLPGLLNSIAGLISTLVNVYGSQNGNFSITAKVTVLVTGICSAITALLFLLYNNWALSRVREQHEKELGLEQRDTGHESMMEKVRRHVRPAAPEPAYFV